MGVYARADSETLWMSLSVQGRRLRKNTGVRDPEAAQEIFAAWQVEMARTRWLGAPPPGPQHTVGELIEEYLAKVTPQKSPDSQRRDRGALGRLKALWGTWPLSDLSTKAIEDYLVERQEDVTFATVSKELGILKAAYARAIRWKWATTSPFQGIALNQEGEERLRWLTDEEEDQLLAVCPPWLQDLVVVGLETGLRRANLVGLEWTWVQQRGTVLVVPRPRVKGKKTAVVIPLTKLAAGAIRRQVRRLDGPWVFTQPDGTPYALDQVGMAVTRAARAAGLTEVSLHTLRHTFVSRLVQEGRPLPEVAALAGHRDIRMTMRYAHLGPSHLREGIQALERRRVGLREPRHDPGRRSRWRHAEGLDLRK